MRSVSKVRAAVRQWVRVYLDDTSPLTTLGLFLGGTLTIALGLVNVWSDVGWLEHYQAWWHLGPLLVGCAANLVRRSRPVLTLVVAALMFVVDAVIGGSFAIVLVLFDGLYVVERFGSVRARGVVRFAAGVVTVATGIAALLGGESVRTALTLTFQNAALLLLPIWWARDVRSREELAAAAHARADLEASRAAARARAQDAEQRSAVQAERSRMARELHDAVAGDVSALVIRAGAALARPPGPTDRESLAAVRESGLHALDELRSMIEVLAAEGDQEPVAPTLTEDGAGLLERSDVMVDGVSPAELGPLAPAVDRAGYRVLQEALTNATRHGRPGSASARLRRGKENVEIRVSNAVENPAEDTSGMGVASMTERAQAVGGILGVQVEEGTWTVTATLPVAHP